MSKTKHLRDDNFITSSTGFFNLSTTDFLDKIRLCWV